MKRVVLLFLLLSSIAGIQAQEKKWDYPVKPGTEQWKLLGSYQERLAKCLVPEEVLNSMTTSELVDICYRYPFFSEISYFQSYKNGIESMSSKFNGLSHLIHRSDCAQSIVMYLIDNNTYFFTPSSVISSIEKVERKAKHCILEEILCYPTVMEKTNQETQKIIVKNAMKSLVFKSSEKYDNKSQSSSALVLCAYLDKLSNKISKDKELVQFLNSERPNLTMSIYEKLLVVYSMVVK